MQPCQAITQWIAKLAYSRFLYGSCCLSKGLTHLLVRLCVRTQCCAVTDHQLPLRSIVSVHGRLIQVHMMFRFTAEEAQRSHPALPDRAP